MVQQPTCSVMMSFLVKGSSVSRSLKDLVLMLSCSTAWVETQISKTMKALAHRLRLLIWLIVQLRKCLFDTVTVYMANQRNYCCLQLNLFDVRQEKCKLTHLIGKYVASNLVGNNVGIICEDAVQNRAVILSCNVMKRKKQAEQQSHSQSAAEVNKYLI